MRSPNRDMLPAARCSSFQLNPAIAVITSRFAKPLQARRRTDRVGGLDDQQRLVAIDDIDRLQLVRMGRQLLAPELHGAYFLVPWRDRFGGHQAAHQLF